MRFPLRTVQTPAVPAGFNSASATNARSNLLTRMKTNLHILPRAFLALTAAVLLTAAAQVDTNRIAIIDLKRVFENYWLTKQANAQLEEQKADIKKKTQAMADDYAKANQEYKKLMDSANDQAVSGDEKDKRKSAAEKKLLEIKEIEQTANLYQRNSEENLGLQVHRHQGKILQNIRDLIEAKAKAEGYAMVIDVTAQSFNELHSPVVLYSSGQNDITEDILSNLNAGAPAGLQKPEEGKQKSGDKKDEKKQGRK
ncbi:MAG: hypothetical protein DME19_06345 [Verrucomicrobia bacterium]|nr:MAG: hypothetical protein DME19_06345 [Verrucomicrobiota bacterium]